MRGLNIKTSLNIIINNDRRTNENGMCILWQSNISVRVNINLPILQIL